MSLNSGSWVIYALLAAVFAALTTIFAKIGVSNINSNVATAIRTFVILLIAWGIVFFQREWEGWAAISSRTLLFLILSGAATGLSWIFYFRARQLGPASLVAPIDKSSLILIILFSALFLGEPLTWQVALGAGLIVIGTIVLIH